MPDDRPGTAVRRDRFSGGPARDFLSSMDNDGQLFAADLAVDRAHTVMLTEAGVHDDEEAAAILDGLDAIEAAGYDALPDAEDVHEAIETALIESIGEVGGKLHTARSRNDEVATCIRYRLRELVFELAGTLIEARAGFASVVGAHCETVMPGYTHLQPAQPTTVAHWACSYERALARDTGRLLDAYERINRSPLGAAAFAGTPYPVDPERTAELLGFDGPFVNAMDAVSSRDVGLESLGVACSVSMSLSGLAEDLIVFANRGFVEIDDDFASTSSIMPQKKNPDTLELVRATAGDTIGAHTAAATVLKGLPRAYNRDLQAVTPQLFDALEAVTAAVEIARGAVVSTTWNAEQLAQAAEDGGATATDIADYLAMQGMPFRDAHATVAAVASEHPPDTDSAAFSQAMLDAVADTTVSLDAETLGELVSPAASVARRDSPGGPGPSAIAAQLETITANIEDDRAAIETITDSLDAAAAALDGEVNAYA